MGSNKEDIKPINLKNEKDISAEFIRISSILENPSMDWNKRLDALKTLQGMVLGSTSQHELFMPNFLRLYPVINLQLKDLRSAVQKEACKLLTLSAEKLQRSFEQVAAKYITKDSLLSIINSGNKILCENAHSCVQSIIEFCPSINYLNPILEESQSKSQQVRSRVSQFLVQIIADINPQQLEKFLPQLDATIGKGVQDANPEVRQNFRSVFMIYRKIYPQKAERIFANFDSSIKKLLQEEERNEQSGTSNQRLIQQKSLEVSVGNNSSLASSQTQKLHLSNSLGPSSDEGQFHFASSTTSGSNNIPRSSQNKTPTHQQKQNNIITFNSNVSNGQSQLETTGNAVNKNNRNGSAHMIDSSIAKNNIKQGQGQLPNERELRNVSPLVSREQVSPKKIMTQSTPKLPPQPESLKQIKPPQTVQGTQNQRYNNFQDNQGKGNNQIQMNEGQYEEQAGRKMQAYRSQDNFVNKKNAEKNIKEEGQTAQRANNSLNRLQQSANTNGVPKKMDTILQKRSSLTEENQYVSKNNSTNMNSQNQRGMSGTLGQEKMKNSRKEQDRNVGDIDDTEYELKRRRSYEQTQGYQNNDDDQDQEEEDYTHEEQELEQEYKKEEEQFNHGRYHQVKKDRVQKNEELSVDLPRNVNQGIQKQNQGAKRNNGNINISNNSPQKNYEYNKNLAKSAISADQYLQNNQSSIKYPSSTTANNYSLASKNGNNLMKSNELKSPIAKTNQNMGNPTTKMNNYLVNEYEDQNNIQKEMEQQQEEGPKKNGYLSRSKVQSVNQGKTLKQDKYQQNIKEETTQNKDIGNPSATVSWRDEDLELLIEKSENTSNWSTRASAFDSMKEVFGELASAGKDLSNNKGELERVNSQLMKKMVNSHISHLSDSHFKVITACLDSFISLLSYDTTFVLPHLDQLMFKVLNNLIDTKDVVSSKANFLVNILSKVFPGDKLIEPIQKVLEQTNKNLLKICSLEVLMVTVKSAEEYYQAISNVRHTVQLMCMIICENNNQKQLALPSLGIILALRDHNPQATLHSILSLTNQNQITALRNLSYEFAQDLEEDLRKYVQKENIKPLDKITKSNIKSFQVEQSNYAIPLQQNMNVTQKSTQSQQQTQPQQQTQSKPATSYSDNNNNNYPQPMNKSQQQIPSQQIQVPGVAFDMNNLEDILSCVSNFEVNESYIIQQINQILLSTVNFFKQSSRKIKETALKVLSALFLRNYFYLTIQPHTVFECLGIYSFVPKDMDFYQVNEIIDEMIDCVPHLIFMKALVEKLNSEQPPQLQIMIKKISYILKKARKEEIRPFLDHIIDSFKISINDQSPDVRKSVVFCLVDLKFLMQEEVDPYFYQFTGNQQKLVEIYVKKRISPQQGGEQQPE